jgi:hypothetical protein
VDGCLLVPRVVIALRIGLIAYAGRRVLSLLYDRLLDEGLRLAMQVAHLRH